MATTIGRLTANLGINSGSFTQGLERARRDLQSFGAGVNRAMAGAERSFSKFNKTADRNVLTLRGMRGAIQGLAAGATLVQTTRSLDNMTNSFNKLRLATGSSDGASKALELVNQVSVRTQASLGATVDLFQKTVNATRQMGTTTADVLKITESFNNTLRISGTNAQGAEAAILQFGQALGSGVLAGDEFKSINEVNSKFMTILAKEMGVARGALKDLASEGAITSDILARTLLNNFVELQVEAAKIAPTFDKVFSLFSGQLSLGFFTQLNQDVSEFTQSLLNPETLDGIRQLGSFIGLLVKTTAEGFMAMAMWVVKFGESLSEVGSTTRSVINYVIGSFVGLGSIILNSFEMLPDALDDIFTRAFNYAVTRATEGVNSMIGLLNKLPGVKIDTRSPELMVNDSVGAAARYRSMLTDYDAAKQIDYVGAIGNSIKSPTMPDPSSIKLPGGGSPTSLFDPEQTKEGKKQVDQLKKQIEELKFRNEQFSRSNDEQELYNQLRTAGVELDSAAGREIEKLVNQYNALTAEQDELEASQQRVKDMTNSLSEAFAGLFEEAIMGAEDLGDVFQATLDQIYRAFLKFTVTDPLNEGLASLFEGISSGGGLGSIFGSIFGGSSTADAYTALDTELMYSDLSGFRAGGGGVSAMSSYVVGENGPEVFIPRTAGSVIPNNKLMGEAGGGGVIVNVYNNGNGEVTTRTSESQGQTSIDIMIDEAVARNVNTGGSKTRRSLRQFNNTGITGR